MLAGLAIGAVPGAEAADGDLTAVLLKDVNSGTASSTPTSFVQVGDKVMFIATDTTSGQEWRVSDGTPGGTTLLKVINPGAASSTPFAGAQIAYPGTAATAQVFGGSVYFAANDGSGIGKELWKSDGTAAGTVLVKDINPGAGDSLFSSGGVSGSASEFRVVGSTLYFTANDGTGGEELWKTDGTAAGTVLVKDINPGPSPSFTSGSSPTLAAVGNTLFFQATDGTTGGEFWKSDGTAAGTVLVKDVAPGSGGSTILNITAVGTNVAFRANNGTNGGELWASDGTTSGTFLVKDINPGTGNGASTVPFAVVGSKILFNATDGTIAPAHGNELWTSDLTTAGTALVQDTTPGTGSGSPQAITPFGDGVLMRDGNGDAELWKSDGTDAGTVLVKNIAPSAGQPSSPANFAVVGSTVYFSATNGSFAPSSGVELFKTDGTAAGTVLVRDINAGTTFPLPSSNPTLLTPALGNLFFSATDGTTAGVGHGLEPYYLRTNSAPVASGDAYSTNEDAALTVAAPGVLGNDTDADGDPISATLTRSVFNVSTVAGSTTVTTTVAEFSSTDVGALLVGAAGSAIPTGSTIVSVTDAMTIVISAPASSTQTLAAGMTVTRRAAHGSLTLNSDGSFTYTPVANYNGPDAFGYIISDGLGGPTSTATVSLTVNSVNDTPVAANDSASTAEDTAVTVNAPGVLGNDTDADADTLTAGSASAPANGSVTLNADGSYTYTPNANFNGTDSFTYTANDGTTNSNTATVTITVSSVSDVPVAGDDSYSTSEDVPLTVNAPGVLADDTDGDGDALTAGSASDPAGGSVSLAADGSFTYTPDANFHGTDTFTYTANDGTSGSNTATVTVTVGSVNDVPMAVGDSYSTPANTPVSVAAAGVLGNDTDADGDTLSAGSATSVVGGSVTLNADGSFTYTPNFGFSGAGGFSYAASDGNGGTATATVTITVAAAGTSYLAVNDLSVTEGNSGITSATFTVTRSGDTSGTSKVDYATVAGTATTPSDFTAVSGTLTFGPGQSTKSVTVSVIADTTNEVNETFTLKLSSPLGAVISDPKGVATIVNDDFASGPTTFLTVNDVSIVEGAASTSAFVTFTITRSGVTSGSSTVTYATANGTASAGSDYKAKAATAVTFAAGETTKTVSVKVFGDATVEPDETFKLKLSSPTGATISDGTGIATIVNDD